MYKVVIVHGEFSRMINVINTVTNRIHSTWNSLNDAKIAANDLNRFTKGVK